MKKWYQFYSASLCEEKIQQLVGEITQANFPRLQQIGTPLQEERLQQPVGEIPFPLFFSYVPWGHHILIITKCKSVEEALFYIQRTIDKGLSRNALDNCIRSDIIQEYLPTAEQIKQQIEIAEETFKLNMRKETEGTFHE